MITKTAHEELGLEFKKEAVAPRLLGVAAKAGRRRRGGLPPVAPRPAAQPQSPVAPTSFLDNVGSKIQSGIDRGRTWLRNTFQPQQTATQAGGATSTTANLAANDPGTIGAVAADKAGNIGRFNRFMPGVGVGVAGTMGANMLFGGGSQPQPYQNLPQPQYYR